MARTIRDWFKVLLTCVSTTQFYFISLCRFVLRPTTTGSGSYHVAKRNDVSTFRHFNCMACSVTKSSTSTCSQIILHHPPVELIIPASPVVFDLRWRSVWRMMLLKNGAKITLGCISLCSTRTSQIIQPLPIMEMIRPLFLDSN